MMKINQIFIGLLLPLSLAQAAIDPTTTASTATITYDDIHGYAKRRMDFTMHREPGPVAGAKRARENSASTPPTTTAIPSSYDAIHAYSSMLPTVVPPVVMGGAGGPVDYGAIHAIQSIKPSILSTMSSTPTSSRGRSYSGSWSGGGASSSCAKEVPPFKVRAVTDLEPKEFNFHDGFKHKDTFLKLLGDNKTLVYFDTETTGLGDYHRIIEIAFVKRDFATMRETRLYFLLNPERKSDPGAKGVHGIQDEWLVDKPKFSEIADQILEFVGSYPLIAHNASFDRGKLNGELLKSGRKPLPDEQFNCTLMMARAVYEGEKNKLDIVCQRFGIDITERADCHGAMLDTLLLAAMHPYIAVKHAKFLSESTKGGPY